MSKCSMLEKMIEIINLNIILLNVRKELGGWMGHTQQEEKEMQYYHDIKLMENVFQISKCEKIVTSSKIVNSAKREK